MKTLRFEGSGYEYFKIWIVNILLTIITLGLYYPWAKVRNLRYFYGNALLEDRRFDYHATGKQLFKAYLIAMLLFIVYVIVQQVFPLGSLALLAVLFLAIPWIIWRSMMFSMRMTSFSNVRFGFDGQLGQAYVNFLLLPLLLFICLYLLPIGAVALIFTGGVQMTAGTGFMVFIGFLLLIALVAYIFALMKKRNAMYRINGTTYGQGRFSAELQTKVFLTITFKTIGLSILALVAYIAFILVVALLSIGIDTLQTIGINANDPDVIIEALGASLYVMFIAIYLGVFIFGFSIAAYVYTRHRNYIANHTLLDEKIALGSTLKARTLVWVMLSNLVILVFTAGLGLPWTKVRVARLILENTQVDTALGFDDYITQQQSYQSSLGDQIGDAFDVDAGLAI
ncbi:MAG: YjgN family protein [Pseudomonadota bacterium]